MQVGVFFADFLCRERRIIVELDGHSHDIDPVRDLWRDSNLRELGYRVMHFTNEDVLGNVEGVVTAIRIALEEKPTPSPSRLREGS